MRMDKETCSVRFHLLMEPSTRQVLDEESDKLGITPSLFVRQAIHEKKRREAMLEQLSAKAEVEAL